MIIVRNILPERSAQKKKLKQKRKKKQFEYQNEQKISNNKMKKLHKFISQQ